MMKVIDFHAHAFPKKIAEKAIENLESHYDVKISCRGGIEDLLQHAREGGIEHLVLLSAATKPEVVKINNDWLASIAAGQPGFITAFGSLHAGTTDFAEELDRMKTLGLKGIKIHPEFQGFAIDDPRMWPIYEAIGEEFIVLFHVGDRFSEASRPRKLAKVLDTFPMLRVIAAHLGGWSRWDEATECLLTREIYVDTSSTFWCLSKEERVKLMRLHGTDRILFGTDYPFTTQKLEIADFLLLPLSDSEKEKILYGNARQLLNL